MVRYILGLSLLALLMGCTNSHQQANMQTGAEDSSGETHASSPQPMMPQERDRIRKRVRVAEIEDFIDLNVPEGFARGTTKATIIDTRKFKDPIGIKGAFRGKIVTTGDDEEGEISVPLPPGIPNDMPVGGLMEFGRVGPISSFPGIEQTEFSPPDPSLAVGPSHIVEVVNSAIAIYTKDGTATFTQRLNARGNDPGFFEELDAEDFVFDPKVMYDHTANRFFIVALELIDGTDSFINIAVSDDDDPNGIWFRYRTCSTVQIGQGMYFFDYPGWGFDENGIYVTGNLFRTAGTGPFFNGVLFRSFDKAPLLVGDPAQFTDIQNAGAATVQCAQTFGNNSAPFFIGNDTFSSMEIIALQDPFTSPSFDTFQLTVPSFSSAADAPNGNGANSLLDTIGPRLYNLIWRDGSLWAAHTIGGNGGSAAVARWYEIATNDWPQSGQPTLEQSGEIDPGNSVSTFFPAIYTDAAGNTAVVMAHSSPTETASIAISGRLATDPPGMMSEPVLFATGDFTTTGRWGDYFDIALDPEDNMTFWTIGEVTSNSASGWITSIDSIQISPPPTVADVELNVGEAQQSAVESITITLDGDVEFAEGAISVVQRSTATEPTFEPVTINVSQQLINDQTIATVQFESLVRNTENALEDGNYQLTLTADLVTRSGVPMSEDFVFGDVESDGFFAFYGDSDGNRSIDVFDLLSFRQSFRSSAGDDSYAFFMDFDAGGSVDVFDLLQFRIRFNNTLPFEF